MSVQPPPSHSRAVEDYVKHIYKLCAEGRRATTKKLAERMDLGQGTVSGMLKQLAGRGLVEHKPYRGVELTEQGHRLAMTMIRRHRLIELFLVQTLGYAWHEVDDDAERLEHAVSDLLVERIDQLLGHPDVDPHGAPIPTAAGAVVSQDFKALAELAPGDSGYIRRVADADPEFLEFCHDQGLRLNERVEIVASGPFGSLRIRAGDAETSLPREATERISVEVC